MTIIWEHCILIVMRIIAKKIIREYWERHPDTEQQLKSWYWEAKRADWKSPMDIKEKYSRTASILKDSRVVFNICGNKHRLVVRISYEYRRMLIKFIGNHKEYDQINAEVI